VRGGDPGINNRDAHSGTVVSKIAANHRGPHGGPGPLHRPDDGTILGDLRNERMPGQRPQGRIG